MPTKIKALFILSVLSLASCAQAGPVAPSSAPGIDFPGETKDYTTSQGTSFTVPAKAIVEEKDTLQYEIEKYFIRGVDNSGDELKPYVVEYMLRGTDEKYSAQNLINVDKGICLELHCKILSQRVIERNGYQYVVQSWPAQQNQYENFVLVGGEGVVAQASWISDTPDNGSDSIAAKIAESMIISAKPLPLIVADQEA